MTQSSKKKKYDKLLEKKVWLFDFDGVLVPNHTKKDSDCFVSNAIKLIADFKDITLEEGKELYLSLRKNKNDNSLVVFFINNFPEIDIHTVMSKVFAEYNEKYKNIKPENGAVDIFKKLSRSKTLGILTNNTGEIVKETMERMGYLRFFDKVIAMEELYPFLKPEDHSYKVAAKTFGAKPEDIVFIDDSEENVKASKKFGMLSVHITNTNEKSSTEVADFSFESGIKLLIDVLR